MDVSMDRPLRLSYSSLQKYLQCPYSFYLGHVLGLPGVPTGEMVYGRALHAAVAAAHQTTLSCTGTDDKRRAEAERRQGPDEKMGGEGYSGNGTSGCGGDWQLLQDVLRYNWTSSGFESDSHEKLLYATAMQGLKSFYERMRKHKTSPSHHAASDCQTFTEHKFEIPLSSDLVLSGIFDLINFQPKEALVQVTEYKSRVGDKDPEKMIKNNFQLELYTYAAAKLFNRQQEVDIANNGSSCGTYSSGQLTIQTFLESIEDGRVSAGPSMKTGTDNFDQFSERVENKIFEQGKLIQDGSFEPKPGYTACMFCGHKNSCNYAI
uniref:PD-(D/E)XK endonuclease-like domain-containing protein n=1 Tax=Heterosigma akashiwo TaxID=2829 RepID=A0A7S4D4L5_HETAK